MLNITQHYIHMIFQKLRYQIKFFFAKIPNRIILHNEMELKMIHSNKKPQNDQQKFTLRKKKLFTISLIGSPNSGKSTLFNTIVGERLALTDSIPGMTRDRKEVIIWGGLLKVVDTPGIQHFEDPSQKGNMKSEELLMRKQIFKQTLTAYNQSDIILYVIDGKKGVTKEQMEFSKYIKKYGKADKVTLLVNKCENIDEIELANDIYKLGINKIYYVSGQFGNGVLQLLQDIDKQIPQQLRQDLLQKKANRKLKFKKILQKLRTQIKGLTSNQKKLDLIQWEKQFLQLNKNPEQNSELDEEEINQQSFVKPQQSHSTGRGVSTHNIMQKKPIQICIIGRPNVGKTSLVNHIIGEQKLVVSQVQHTTRDSTINEWTYKNRKIRLVDTAGLSVTNLDNNPQHLKKVQISTMNHVKYSHVVIYLMDSDSALKVKDFSFIRMVIKEGRPVIIAVNKWQMIKNEYKKKAFNFIKNQIDNNLGELNDPPIICISVKMQSGIDQLMDSIIDLYQKWNRRVSTGMLNNWLTKFKKLDNLPIDGFQQLKIRFFVQGKVRPPTFIAFVNNRDLFKNNYLRFMRSNLVQEFKLSGVPLRIFFRNCDKSGKAKLQGKSAKQINIKLRKNFIKKLKNKQRLAKFKEMYGNFGKKKQQ